jgi:hypothetical protein
MTTDITIRHCSCLQTGLVISRQFTTQFTGLNLGVMWSWNTLTGFKSKCKTDGACALLFKQTQRTDLYMSNEIYAYDIKIDVAYGQMWR